MASLKQANLARDQHAERLRKLGAHSIEVRSGASFGQKGHVLVANVPPGFAGKLPDKVDYKIDDTTISVPVAVEEKARFQAE